MLANDGADCAGFDVADGVFDNDILLKRAAEEAEIVEIQGPHVELDNRNGGRADDRIAAALLQRIEEMRKGGRL